MDRSPMRLWALKLGDGMMAITEQGWKRLRDENKRLRSKLKDKDKTIIGLTQRIRELEGICDSKTERLLTATADFENAWADCLQRQSSEGLKENAA